MRAAASVPVQIRLLGPCSFPLLRQPVAQHLDRVTTPVPRLSDEGGARKNVAERAYKKLGVHDRSEAVARARELGLI